MQHVVIETFVWLLGLCAGSFLNVVIYRLPAGLSVARPARSFCPRCQADIAWYDNLPILSWLLLRGRCRHCGSAISLQYPLVEALTGLAFVLVYHLLLPAASRAGLAAPGLERDVPLLAAWLVLVAGLMACSAMDVVSYSIDVRVTNAVVVAGVGIHAAWPRPEFLVPRAQSTAGAAALAALLACVFMLWWTVWRRPEEPPEPEPDEPESPPIESVVVRIAAGAALVLAIGLPVVLVLAASGGRAELGRFAVAAGLAEMFAVVVIVGGQRRVADTEIHEAIEQERPQARWMALGELAWLTPGSVAALGATALLTFLPPVADGWRAAVAWTAGGFAPLAGITFAVHGAVVAAAVGWALRLVFTLAYGREAFGTGDIYMLAAAGAAAGWDIALLGLLLSVGIGLVGWVLGLLLKTTVMIPFGPWLALGFLLALWWSKPAATIAESYRASFETAWHDQPELLLVVGGAMLVGSAAAIVLARLVRRFVESRLEAER